MHDFEKTDYWDDKIGQLMKFRLYSCEGNYVREGILAEYDTHDPTNQIVCLWVVTESGNAISTQPGHITELTILPKHEMLKWRIEHGI